MSARPAGNSPCGLRFGNLGLEYFLVKVVFLGYITYSLFKLKVEAISSPADWLIAFARKGKCDVTARGWTYNPSKHNLNFASNSYI